MMSDSKSADKAFFISELCETFKADELSQLVDIEKSCPANMSHEEFKHQYLKHLKLLYLKNLRAIQQGKYEKVPFQNLNTQIVHAIQSHDDDKAYPLMPRADKVTPTPTDAVKLSARIQALKKQRRT
jgi:hypothetical protein